MITTVYPYVDPWGVKHHDLVQAIPGDGFNLRNKTSGEVYDSVIDQYPAQWEYEEVEKPPISEELSDILDQPL